MLDSRIKLREIPDTPNQRDDGPQVRENEGADDGVD